MRRDSAQLALTFAAGFLGALLAGFITYSFEPSFRISQGSSSHDRGRCAEMPGGPTSLSSVAVCFARSELY